MLLRFEREIKAAGKLNYPNIAGDHFAEEIDGRRHLAIELVDGLHLAVNAHALASGGETGPDAKSPGN